jgi:alginate O-acetyltransferase complex protein AlgI
MLFNDPLYLFVFLPATLAAAYVLQRIAGRQALLWLLVLASIIFYGAWNPLYLPLLGGVTVFTFWVARAIVAARRAGRSDQVSLLLALGVVGDLLVLAYFKYTDFLIGSSNWLFALDIPLQRIILPLGISFFTFQKIAYLVDASRGEVEEHSFLDYCFFVMFFPQLIAGPIVHHREIFSQIKGPHAFAIRRDNLILGVTILAIGLFKKVVIADNLAPGASEVFGDAAQGASLDFFLAWRGAVGYALQLYFDFSGYSDMAIGAARMFGIRLPLNFHSPYQATSIIDFWRRWHMTLSRFLRDYLYVPLGGNRHGKARRYVNLLLTMTIGGLWHGAAWTFVVWGLVHGLYLVVNHGWRAVWGKPIDRWWSRGIARLVTLFAVIVAWVPFRATSWDATLRMFDGMANLPQSLAPLVGPAAQPLAALGIRFDGPAVTQADLSLVAMLIGWIAVLWLVPNTQQLLARFYPAYGYGPEEYEQDPPALARLPSLRPILEWRPTPVWGAAIGLAAAGACLELQHVSEFLYFDF